MSNARPSADDVDFPLWRKKHDSFESMGATTAATRVAIHNRIPGTRAGHDARGSWVSDPRECVSKANDER